MQSSIVIEEFLTGEEISFLTLADGKHVVPLAPAQDHKRIGEGIRGRTPEVWARTPPTAWWMTRCGNG